MVGLTIAHLATLAICGSVATAVSLDLNSTTTSSYTISTIIPYDCTPGGSTSCVAATPVAKSTVDNVWPGSSTVPRLEPDSKTTTSYTPSSTCYAETCFGFSPSPVAKESITTDWPADGKPTDTLWIPVTTKPIAQPVSLSPPGQTGGGGGGESGSAGGSARGGEGGGGSVSPAIVSNTVVTTGGVVVTEAITQSMTSITPSSTTKGAHDSNGPASATTSSKPSHGAAATRPDSAGTFMLVPFLYSLARFCL